MFTVQTAMKQSRLSEKFKIACNFNQVVSMAYMLDNLNCYANNGQSFNW